MMKAVARKVSLLLFGSLLGCAQPKYYPNTLDKNVTMSVKLADNRSSFIKLSARMSVNEITADCTYDYLGTVKLSGGENKLGLAPGKRVVFVLVVSRSGLMTVDTDFQYKRSMVPMPGKQYEIDYSYVDGMMDFRLYEKSTSGRKELPFSAIPACATAK